MSGRNTRNMNLKFVAICLVAYFFQCTAQDTSMDEKEGSIPYILPDFLHQIITLQEDQKNILIRKQNQQYQSLAQG